ncbi:PIG-X [Apodospora peruviana]|uniref:Protein PBN1 n=1 Tax=Apodospora peruviana TaxID=516989 RepID=A0AAE0HV23_9PEZI|nr:PIG-X [Apodospora peruviana]
MRERITFIQKLGDSLEPSSLKINGGVISGPEVKAVREDRVTLALEELPTELQSLLKGVHELHIRWISPEPYESVSPLLARLPPGFHLFFTPGKGDHTASNKLCSTLSEIFGHVNCSTPAESFTSLPSDRFSHSTAFQYYQPLETLSGFVQYAKHQLCSGSDSSCTARADTLAKASSLDISYDTISHALKVTTLWPYQRQPIHATSRPWSRTEVGVLSADKPATLDAHELGISGLLTVLGQDSKPSVTMFTFASRHRDAESAFSTKILEPVGLHPTLQIQLESNKPPATDAYCSPHAYFTLPKGIFADKYQLGDDLFLASKNLTALRYISQPVDLEAPEYVMKGWGSAVLLQLTPPKSDKAQPWTAEIPLHLRYLEPNRGGYETIEVPYPAVFWACTAEEGTKFPNNPFERVNLGYDGLFGPRTVFWHVEPRPLGGGQLQNAIRVPVLDLDKSAWVNIGTAVAVLVGFAWVAWRLAAVYLSSGYGNEAAAPVTEAGKEKKRQ